MKFFWKIFFAFTAVITVAFSTMGIWMINQSFRNSLTQEIEEGDRENRMYQMAFEVNVKALPDNYQTERLIAELTDSVVSNLDTQQYVYRLYRGRQQMIYTSRSEMLITQLVNSMGSENCIYTVVDAGHTKYLMFACKSVLDGKIYYLESYKDITAIYAARDDLYDQYLIIMLAMIAVSGIVILIMSRFLTRSVGNLSSTTRQFSDGDYSVRASISSDDEIGALADDFNEMAEHLSQKMEDLTEVARKQEDFSASFAHELKTPLTSIIGYADMLRTMDMSREETMDAANYIYSQGKRLESLSLKLLDLIVMGKQEFRFRQIYMPDFMDEVRISVEAGLEQKHVLLSTEMEDGEVSAEHDLLMSLVINLIDNARKAVAKGGHIEVKGRKTEGAYVLTIRDDGIGMPKEEISKITEAFYMVDKSRSRKEGGAGLGMTLCNRIVELHHAQWMIESEQGKGTLVTVTFPEQEVHHE